MKGRASFIPPFKEPSNHFMVTEVTFTSPESGPNAPVEENNTPAAERPAWLPAEFNTPEDFAKSYGDLRADHTRKAQELATLKRDPATPAPITPPNTDPAKPAAAAAQTAENAQNDPPRDDPADAAKKVADAANFDLTSYNDEYAETGDVSAESRAKIIDGLKGVLGNDAETLVNQYIDGQKAVHTNQRNDFYNAAGGEDNYNRMLEFARATMSEAERTKFNTHITGNDHDVRMMALESLKSRYEAQNGRIPHTTIRAKAGASAGGVAPFANSAQMVLAMSDPRYDTDEAYRAEVGRRIAASPNL